jgi:hypothetical protein
MEHHYDTKIESLELIIEKQQNMIERLECLELNNIPISAENIYMQNHHKPSSLYRYYNCKELKLTTHVETDLTKYNHNSVEYLILKECYLFNSYNGLQNMPSLERLYIEASYNNSNKPTPIEKDEFLVGIFNITNIISSYNHTIREINIKLKLIECQKDVPILRIITYLSELQTYCKKNNIDLIVQ